MKSVSGIAAFAMAMSQVSAQGQSSNNPCCLSIQASLPQRYSDSRYGNFNRLKKGYYTAQEGELTPNCFVQPITAEEVSTVIQVLNKPQYQNLDSCKFAIKSGGATPWAGAANIQGGVTIDLSKMKSVEVSRDGRMVQIGPGNKWGEVYAKLQPLGIAVSGGRWGNVGVGGLLTGGGLSFFQGFEGPSCDGIINHQVVLSNGSIINANQQVNADLHRVLKGGNNNFGIVTRFDVKSYSVPAIWGGTIVGKSGRQNLPLKWLEMFSSSANTDPNGQLMLSLTYNLKTWSHSAFVTYAKPDLRPPPFIYLLDRAAASNTNYTTYLSVAQKNGVGGGGNGRLGMATFSFVNSAAYIERLLDLAQEFSNNLPMLSGMTLIFQPLWTTPRQASFAASGGNILGLENSNDDLIIVQVQNIWIGKANDNAIADAAQNFVDAATQLAREMSVYSPYLYANYAAQWQHVTGSYGEASMNLMRAASQTYDPIQLFQNRCPGGYKLQPPARRPPPNPQAVPQPPAADETEWEENNGDEDEEERKRKIN